MQNCGKSERAHFRQVIVRLMAKEDLDLHEAFERAAEEERLAVLRMIENGKISVDEAETLFQALEGNS